MSDGLPPPVATLGSSGLYNLVFWTASDNIVEAGAVIVDRNSDRVLLVYDERRKMHTLPRSRADDFEVLMKSPLSGVAAKTGIPCSRLSLPRLSKQYVVPPDKNWDELRATVNYTPSELTTDPFYVSFSTEWRKSKDARWPDGFQISTYWYSGYIDVEDPEQHILDSQLLQPCLLVPIQDALARLEGKDGPAHRALSLFDSIWRAAKQSTDQTAAIIPPQSSPMPTT